MKVFCETCKHEIEVNVISRDPLKISVDATDLVQFCTDMPLRKGQTVGIADNYVCQSLGQAVGRALNP